MNANSLNLAALCAMALAGLLSCIAALRWWTTLGIPVEERAPGSHGGTVWQGAAFAALTVSLGLSLGDPGHRDFAYGVLGLWAAVAGLLFATGWLTGPTRGLLALPVGCMAILLTMAGAATPVPAEAGVGSRAVIVVHAACMAAHLAAALVAGGAGGLWLITSRLLKSAQPRALRLPTLPLLATLTERALVVAAALLMAGLAAGGAALQMSPQVRLLHPSILLALLSCLLLVVALALRLSDRLGRRGLAMTAVQVMVLAALGALALQVVAHG